MKERIIIDLNAPELLDTTEKVKNANRILREYFCNMLPDRPWRLGDHCWYHAEKDEK